MPTKTVMVRETAAERLKSGAGAATLEIGPPWEDAAAGFALVAAHPDDGVIGASSLLPRLAHGWLLHATNGTPRGEAVARGAGVPVDRVLDLGFAERELPRSLAALARKLRDMIARVRSGAVLTHPYEGGHPDHDATAFGVHAACALMRQEGVPAPEIYEMTSYHCGSKGQVQTGVFLDGMGSETHVRRLTPEERRRKAGLFACFPTQRTMLAIFPLDVERFRPAPAYDFTQPPHAGLLWYERFPWGMDGDRFRDGARRALGELGLKGWV